MVDGPDGQFHTFSMSVVELFSRQQVVKTVCAPYLLSLDVAPNLHSSNSVSRLDTTVRPEIPDNHRLYPYTSIRLS